MRAAHLIFFKMESKPKGERSEWILRRWRTLERLMNAPLCGGGGGGFCSPFKTEVAAVWVDTAAQHLFV